MSNVFKWVAIILLFVGGIWYLSQSILSQQEIIGKSTIVQISYWVGSIGLFVAMIIPFVVFAIGGFDDDEGNKDNNKKDKNAYKF